MARTARSYASPWTRSLPALLTTLLAVCLSAVAQAQTATYRLHRESSSTTGLFQLKTANPDAAILAVQSANLKNSAVGEYIVKAFDTQTGVPNSSGVITAGSTVTFTLWMKKTATAGTMFPRVKLNLNSATGSSICVVTGTTALTTTLTKYILTGTVPSNVSMTASNRFYLWVGVNLTATTSVNNQAEVDIEGTVNGNYDSQITVPLPTPPPSISSLSPTSGIVATAITIAGSNFGATQGTSTVTFNGVTATPSSWSNTNIVAPVPAGATNGPVVVTARGSASNGVTFTVLATGTIAGTITRSSDSAAINGALVEALQGGVVKFSATTAANGGYTMPGVIAGTYDVRASAIGYQTKIQNGVTVNGGATSTVNQTLDPVAAGDINYVYDELGKLVSVVTPAETVTYSYDAVGNLSSISRQNTNLPSITEFTPNGGAVGTTVTIYGTGFSATAGQNTVKFNGVTATVTSATATQLVTTVPAGATTGPVTVNTPTGLATSSTSFIVSASAIPTITGFNPTIGTAGTAVTITGTNFETVAANNRVAFNNRYALVNSATTTAIATSPPAGATSGHISVATPAGNAVSTTDFFVPPSPYAAADVEVTGRMALGESRNVALSTAGKIGLLLFDGASGQRVSLNVNSSSITSCRVTIYNPDGTTLASITANTGGFVDTPLLPATGTYTILIDPDSTYTGNLNFTLYNATDVTAAITPAGPPVTLTTTVPGQNAQASFSGSAGQRVSLNISGVTMPGTTSVALMSPDGTSLVSASVGSSGAFIESPYLPSNGTYVISVDPAGTNIGSMTLTLYDASDVTGTITPGGAPVTVTTTTLGQNAKLTFSAAANQRVSLKITGVSITGGSHNWVDIFIKKADGTTLASTLVDASGGFIDVQTLALADTYSVFVDPQDTGKGSVTLTLYDVPADFTGTITPNGPPMTLTTTVAGQNGQLTFDGTANQRVSLKITGVALTGGNRNWVNVSIKRPDGTTLASSTFDSGGGFIDVQTLPVTGTYTILADPWDTSTGSVTLTLYDVPADFTGTITPGGPPVTATTDTAGQNAQLTFSGAANQRVSLKITGVVLTGGSRNWVSVAIKKPDGSSLASSIFDASGGFIDVQTLPVTGTYTVLVDPWDTSTGSVTLTLYDVPADVTSAITPGGAAVTITNTIPGQNGQATFSGTANQRVSLRITGVALTGGYRDWVNVTIKKPDGSSLASSTYDVSGGYIDVQTLPVAGTYTILVDPWDTSTGDVTLTLYDVPADASNTTTVGAAAVSVATTVPGQNAQVTFAGTSGQQVTVHLTNNTMGVITVKLLKPDGTVLTSTVTSGSSFDLATQTLPVNGTYTISIDPSSFNTGSINVSVTTP